jgi:hypothetical protein
MAVFRMTQFLLVFAVLITGRTSAGPDSTNVVRAPVERSRFSMPTSYDSLQGFLSSLGERGVVSVERIAVTREGRAVSACLISSSRHFGEDAAKLRVMLFAQQHGDEPSGKEALTLLLAKLASGQAGDLLKALDIIIVPQMNPDGAERRQRRTSDTLDLNRNHVLLSSPETRGLHELFFRWLPQVTLDMHEYGSFSRSWSDSGIIKAGDVQLGMLTNLNSSVALRQYQRRAVYPFIAKAMEKQGFTFNEYIVGSPSDRIRHSTTEINDGRQSFGILNTLSFIQEGRKWRTIEEQLERRAKSQLAGVEALLAFCAGHAAEIRALVQQERQGLTTAAGSEAVLWMDHEPGGGRMVIPVHDVRTDRDTTWVIRPYHEVVRAQIVRTVPSAYVVPGQESTIIELLGRHHITCDTVREARSVRAVALIIDSVGYRELEEDTLPALHVHPEEQTITLHPGDRIVPTRQWHSLFLASVLEPESSWGIVKYREFEGILKRRVYPIYRIP